ncbi:hypothetical protein ES705_38248 [subsurface metagenome]
MKKLFISTFLLFSVYGLSQELLNMGYAWSSMDFEDTIEYKYVKIIDNELWQIARPQKDILFLEPEDNLGEISIITDSVAYYPNNALASFQFRIFMDIAEKYRITFYHKYDFEENVDGGIIETSYDDGLTWQNILFDTLIQNNLVESINLYQENDIISSYDNQPGFTGLQSDVNHVVIEFMVNGNYNDTMLLKYTIATDSYDAQNEGWLLDRFYFSGITVGIEPNVNNPGVKISPNPSKDLLAIYSEASSITNVEIFSLDGKKLLSENSYDITSVDISKLKAGIYLILCSSEDIRLITKIQKL